MNEKILAVGLFALSTLFGSQAANAAGKAGGKRVCTLYSTVVLSADEQAEVHGAGQTSVSLLIKGKAGEWIFYDALGDSGAPAAGDALFLKSDKSTAFRRSHDSRVYSVLPNPVKNIGGKPVNTAASGLDFRRQPLGNPALKGTDADKAILKRILPGEIGKCDLRWKPGTGLVK